MSLFLSFKLVKGLQGYFSDCTFSLQYPERLFI